MENIKQLLTVPFSQANYKKFSINLCEYPSDDPIQ